MAIFNKTKDTNNNLNNNFNKPKLSEEEQRRKRRNKFIIGFLIAALVIILIIILATSLSPKTTSLLVYSLSASQTANNVIYLNTNVGIVAISSLKGASATALSVTSTNSIYAVYIPDTSIGRIQFQYQLFNYENNEYLKIGSTIINTSYSSALSNISNSNSIWYGFIPKKGKTLDQELTSWFNALSASVIGFNVPSGFNALQVNALLFAKFIYLNTSLVPYPVHQIPWGVIVQLIFLVVFILLMFLSFYSIARGGMAGGGNDLFSIGKSLATIAKPNTKFTDVGGIKEEKYELQEIVDFLKNPFKYTRMGARVPKGVILYGPPGTGKTLLAKAVAGEANVPFFETSGATFEDMLVGVGAKRIRELFAKARKNAPAIIFIDEIDAVASKRSQNKMNNGLENQTINQLLSEMDGFNNQTGIIVIAATNRLDTLDEAILRPGRFDRQIQVNLPDIDERVQILQIHARNKRLSSDVSFEEIARKTPGFSGAQLENALNEAALMSVRRNHTWITMQDIDEGIDRVVGGPAKITRKVVFEEKKQISFHEAGHALVGLYVPGSEIVEKITIIPRGQAAGYTVRTPANQELSIQKKSDLLGFLATALGGRASEEIIYGQMGISTGASDDLNKATKLARSMVMQFGMTDLGLSQYTMDASSNPYFQQYSEEVAKKIDLKVNEILQERYEFAKQIIKDNERELELIVESLLILETIDRKQIEYIHQEKKLPKQVVKKIYFLIDTKQLDEKYLFEVEKNQFLKGINNPYNKDEYTSDESNQDNEKSDKNDNSNK